MAAAVAALLIALLFLPCAHRHCADTGNRLAPALSVVLMKGAIVPENSRAGAPRARRHPTRAEGGKIRPDRKRPVNNGRDAAPAEKKRSAEGAENRAAGGPDAVPEKTQGAAGEDSGTVTERDSAPEKKESAADGARKSNGKRYDFKTGIEILTDPTVR